MHGSLRRVVVSMKVPHPVKQARGKAREAEKALRAILRLTHDNQAQPLKDLTLFNFN